MNFFIIFQFTSIASGPHHTLFVDRNMKVWCFGYNEHGQCGREIQTPLMTPKPIENLMGLNIAQVSCGRRHSLFLTDRNEVYACGSNEQGQLGIGVEFTQISTPVKIDVPPIKKIGCGESTEHIIYKCFLQFECLYPNLNCN